MDRDHGAHPEELTGRLQSRFKIDCLHRDTWTRKNSNSNEVLKEARFTHQVLKTLPFGKKSIFSIWYANEFSLSQNHLNKDKKQVMDIKRSTAIPHTTKGHWPVNWERIVHALSPCLGRGGPLAELWWTRGCRGRARLCMDCSATLPNVKRGKTSPISSLHSGIKGPHAHRLIILLLTVKQERCSDLLLW